MFSGTSDHYSTGLQQASIPAPIGIRCGCWGWLLEEIGGQLVMAQYPELNYHPIAFSESQGDLILDPYTESLLHIFFVLNQILASKTEED